MIDDDVALGERLASENVAASFLSLRPIGVDPVLFVLDVNAGNGAQNA